MARRSKTKVSGQSAGRDATAARARTTETHERETERRERRAAEHRGHLARGIQQTAGAAQQQIAAERDREFRGEQADAQRAHQASLQDQRLAASAEQAGEGRQLSREQLASNEQLSREQMDLQAARSGLQRAAPAQSMQLQQPGGLAPGEAGPPMPEQQGPPADPAMQQRQAQLDAEIERGQRQTAMGGEMDRGRFIPTEQAASQREQELGIAQMRAETDRDRVQVMKMNSLSKARASLRQGDKEAYKAAREDYASRVRKMGERAERLIKSQMDPRVQLGPDDTGYIQRLAGDNPDPELQRELSEGKPGPAAARFLRGRMVFDQLDFVSETGDWADPDLVDEAHPIYQEFQRHVVNAGQLLKQRQSVGGIAGISSLHDANRMKRRIAAITMKEMARRKRQRAAMGGGENQPLPSAPNAGGQPNVDPGSVSPPSFPIGLQQQQPGVTPVQRPQLPELPPPPATLGR